MRKLFKIAILGFTLLINLAYSQSTTDRKVKLACYTTSCCSFLGFFDVDLISTTHCHYVVTNKDGSTQNIYSSHFESSTPIRDGSVNLAEDVVMPQFKDENGNPLVMEKGEYKITNNQVEYPLSSKIGIKKVCLQEHVTGTILGHEVDYTITVCAYYPSWGKSASTSIKLDLNENQREEIRKNNNIITFKNDITVKNENGTYIIKAGDYFVNENDEVYIINSLME
ncbi:hypothetical protein U9K52_00565 [Chryseobacterium sp. MHB01]|uniref:hypothetical protein n=1 Tax=Chryseobacterium sp. MHB01 TaxID=3109433 RepID=UPI002AFE823E|nr:hypothetical protein [Chryseobacterium sp. MHB01]MEA1847388.1 hypothetical protein [Chryseobacterium sp. MHB01]